MKWGNFTADKIVTQRPSSPQEKQPNSHLMMKIPLLTSQIFRYNVSCPHFCSFAATIVALSQNPELVTTQRQHFFPRVLRIWSRTRCVTWKRAFLREVLHNAAILSNGSTKKMRNDTKKMSTEWEGFTNTRHCEDTRFFFFWLVKQCLIWLIKKCARFFYEFCSLFFSQCCFTFSFLKQECSSLIF